jgi:hypothetical protein
VSTLHIHWSKYNFFNLNRFDWMFQGHNPQLRSGVRTQDCVYWTSCQWKHFDSTSHWLELRAFLKFCSHSTFSCVLMTADLSNTWWLEYHISFLLYEINITTEHPLRPLVLDHNKSIVANVDYISILKIEGALTQLSSANSVGQRQAGACQAGAAWGSNYWWGSGPLAREIPDKINKMVSGHRRGS